MKIMYLCVTVTVFFGVMFIITDEEMLFYFFSASIIITLAGVLGEVFDRIEDRLKNKTQQ